MYIKMQRREVIINVSKGFVFVLLFLMILLHSQEVLTPKWEENSRPRSTFNGPDAMRSPENIDVFFIGTSQIYCGISPMTIYEQNHIATYNFASPVQTIQTSYALAGRIINRYAPKVIVLDAGSLFFGVGQSSARYVLDSLPLDVDKLRMISDYRDLNGEDPMISLPLPLYNYHTRWSKLSRDDFRVLPPFGFHYAAGQYLMGASNGTLWPEDRIQETLTEQLRLNEQGKTSIQENGELWTGAVTSKLFSAEANESNVETLKKIKELCDRNNVEFLLIKVPSRGAPNQSATWSSYKSNIAREIAQDCGVEFLDLLYDVDIGIDNNTDWWGGGFHMSVSGAEKVSKFLGDYLSDHYSLSECEDEDYNRAYDVYSHMRTISALQSIDNFQSYLEMLKKHDTEWTVFISGNNAFSVYFNEDDAAAFTVFNSKLIGSGTQNDSYVAIIDNGEMCYEALSNRLIDYYTQHNGLDVSLGSVSQLNDDYQGHPGVRINGIEYSPATYGLNIVVWDKIANRVIDCVCFNTAAEWHYAYRNITFVNQLYFDYETAYCF